MFDSLLTKFKNQKHQLAVAESKFATVMKSIRNYDGSNAQELVDSFLKCEAEVVKKRAEFAATREELVAAFHNDPALVELLGLKSTYQPMEKQ